MTTWITRHEAASLSGLSLPQIGRLCDLALPRTCEGGGVLALDVETLASRVKEAAFYLAKTRETAVAPGPVEKVTVH